MGHWAGLSSVCQPELVRDVQLEHLRRQVWGIRHPPLPIRSQRGRPVQQGFFCEVCQKVAKIISFSSRSPVKKVHHSVKRFIQVQILVKMLHHTTDTLVFDSCAAVGEFWDRTANTQGGGHQWGGGGPGHWTKRTHIDGEG